MTDANERRSAGPVDSLLETADRWLRRAKGEGKDRWDAGSEDVGVHVQAT